MYYLPIIGMEIHVEPSTTSKMFCECSANHFQIPANTHTCPVCLGLPGALPIPNQAAIDACIRLGLALECQINQFSKFDRKNYFYHDLPKSYQISQYDLPFCYQGSLSFPKIEGINLSDQPGKVGITRVHMEEDTGKLIHDELDHEKVSLVDFNRSGVPLIEIVTEPDLHSASDTKQFLKWLTRMIQYLGISDCDMEKGAMRLEANISVAQLPEAPADLQHIKLDSLPSYKVEIKNVNSFRYIEKAIEIEIARHIEILKQGQIPKQETRGYSEDRNTTFSQRSKETAKDYRYFPEPDIPPIVTSSEHVDGIKSQIIRTPNQAFEYLQDKGVRADFAEVICDTPASFNNFTQLLEKLPSTLTPGDAGKMIVNQKINLAIISADETLRLLTQSIKTYGLSLSDTETLVQQVLDANPQQVAEYKAGKHGLLGFFVGQVSKLAQGQADPKHINQLLQTKLT